MNPYPLAPTIGTMPEEKIPGRDNEITRILRLLRSQSVTVEELRRMGKTMLLLKMAYLSNNDLLPEEFKHDNFRAKYMSFQGKQNLGEVIDMIISHLKDFDKWYKIDFSATYNFIRDVVASPEVEVAGTKFSLKLPEYKKSWKEIFYKTLENIAEAQSKANATLILIFDELPIMLWEWYKEGRHEDALELLDILRERRQMLEKQGIRFVYCGSIGIKVVLNTFRTEFKYTGEPTNEMAEFDLNPFSKQETGFLCECFLLSNFKVKQEEKIACLERIHTLSNGLPFHISNMFNLLQTEFDYNISIENIDKTYQIILEDPRQHAPFRQLIDRLNIYYQPKMAKNMAKLLNVLSQDDTFLSEEELHNKTQIDDFDDVKKNLLLLFGDHYLVREINEEKRRFKFKYQIFRQWWKTNIA